MSIRRLLSGAAVAILLVGGGAGIARADNVVADSLQAVDSTLAFGTIACNSGASLPVDLYAQRAGAGQVWSNGATLTVTASSNNAAVTAAGTTISLPGTWESAPNNTIVNPTSNPDVTVTPTAAGAGTALVTYTATGAASGGGTLARTDAVTVTWTGGPCSTPTTTTVTCPASPVTYTGASLTPCTAHVSGSGGFTQNLSVSYSANVNVGTVTASASFAGDATHLASSGSATFAIAKASSTTAVSCPTSVAWTGAAQTPCTATVSGVGGLSQSLTPTYSANTAVGTATASASYAGDANHSASNDSRTFDITRAPSTVTVTCTAGPFTFTGSAHTPCSAEVTSINGFSQALSVDYTGNIDAGTAHADASFAGDAEHAPASGGTTFVIGKADATVTVTCDPTTVQYDNTPHALCTATATGPGGLNEPVAVTYDDNVNAGLVTASATRAASTNYAQATGSATFTISKAPVTVLVTCTPSTVTYTGAALEPCSATVNGVGLTEDDVDVTYQDNVDVGTGTASASYAGDGNHLSGTDSETFTIAQASTTTVITCPATQPYTGSAIEPCTAAVTGAGLVGVTVTPTYDGNVNVGTAAAHASYAGDANHTGSTATDETFEITKATTTVAITCPVSEVYTGAAIEPCTAGVTGAGLVGVTVTPTYDGNTNVGTATAHASYTGDANHTGSTATDETFAITKATSTTAITCPTSVTYTSSAIEPCTAHVTGAGSLDEYVGVDYTDNVIVGTAHASAAYLGDANHEGSTDTETFAILKAPSTVQITCTSPVTYTGSPLTPCSATVTGVGGLNESVPVSYGANTAAGTATASALWPGDSQHTGDTDDATFTIAKAPTTVTVTCPTSVTFTGSPITPCTATATSAGPFSASVPVTYSANTAVGTATANATFPGDANHLVGSGSKTFAIAAWTNSGFYQPVDMGPTLNTVKAGSTVPLKFELFAGTTELTNVSAIQGFTVRGITCGTTAPVDDIELTTTGGTSLRYDSTAGQFIQNWQTPKNGAGSCYQVTMTTVDNVSSISANFKLK